MARVFIGIGSNVGDRQGHISFARKELAGLAHTAVVGFSPSYETDPVGPSSQLQFLNAVAQLETSMDPFALLACLQQIELGSGRPPIDQRQQWGPRTLDLDLLLFGQEVICSEQLTVPHPLMHERWFVLKPLVDLAPNAVHPVLQMTVESLLESVASPARPAG